MAWSLSGVTISPQDNGDKRQYGALYALQNVLDATTTTKSFYGAESEKRTLDFILFENSNGGTGLSTLATARATDANVALVSDQGAEGNYRILSLTASRKKDTANTLPVWMCSVELIKAD